MRGLDPGVRTSAVPVHAPAACRTAAPDHRCGRAGAGSQPRRPADRPGRPEPLVTGLALGQRVDERVHVARGHPHLAGEDHGRVQADDVVALLDHGLPPLPAYILLQLHAQGSVVPGRPGAAVNLTRRVHEAAALGQAHHGIDTVGHGFSSSRATAPVRSGLRSLRAYGYARFGLTRLSGPYGGLEPGSSPVANLEVTGLRDQREDVGPRAAVRIVQVGVDRYRAAADADRPDRGGDDRVLPELRLDRVRRDALGQVRAELVVCPLEVPVPDRLDERFHAPLGLLLDLVVAGHDEQAEAEEAARTAQNQRDPADGEPDPQAAPAAVDRRRC